MSVHAELPISGQPAPLHTLNGNVVKGNARRGICKYFSEIFGMAIKGERELQGEGFSNIFRKY